MACHALCTTRMFVILHDIGRLQATRLKDNNEISASVAGAIAAANVRRHYTIHHRRVDTLAG